METREERRGPRPAQPRLRLVRTRRGFLREVISDEDGVWMVPGEPGMDLRPIMPDDRRSIDRRPRPSAA